MILKAMNNQTSKQARRFTPRVKWQTVLEVLQGRDQTQVARSYSVHPTSLTAWKKQVLAHGPELFATSRAIQQLEQRNRDLETLLGKKEVEIALLKNFLTPLT